MADYQCAKRMEGGEEGDGEKGAINRRPKSGKGREKVFRFGGATREEALSLSWFRPTIFLVSRVMHDRCKMQVLVLPFL